MKARKLVPVLLALSVLAAAPLAAMAAQQDNPEIEISPAHRLPGGIHLGQRVNLTGDVIKVFHRRVRHHHIWGVVLQTEEGNARILVLRKWIMRLPDNTRFPVPAYSVAIALRNSHATIGAIEILNGSDEVIGYIALWVQTDAFSARMLRR